MYQTPTGHKECMTIADRCAKTSVQACYSTTDVLKATSGQLFPVSPLKGSFKVPSNLSTDVLGD